MSLLCIVLLISIKVVVHPFRSQVQDMNTALKNSLEHIRRLRIKAAVANKRWDSL